MNITFLGAAKTVTGSCYLIETEKTKFLVDCGMFQGHSKETELNEQSFPFNPSEIDFVLLTHSHIDHSGRIPKLYVDGFKGEVIFDESKPDGARRKLLDISKIKKLGWSPRISPDEGIRKTYQWYRNHVSGD